MTTRELLALMAVIAVMAFLFYAVIAWLVMH
jgi:hypothetical protein